MKIRNKKGGYSIRVAREYIDPSIPIYSLSSEFEIQYRFDEGKPTNDISGYKAWFSQEGLPPFTVKFLEEVILPPYQSLVTLENLQACEVNHNVYFKADNIKEIK
ncbi:hypothetical protein PYH69_11490 [Mammaliicoccus lentus]|uniref:SuB0782 undefined product 764400:764714 forward MW:11955 n=1 Tax=Mammaliicoccus lentus TaxID=42858 RepID=A0AAX3W2C7_MAMLE|nr:hypothetical protein [Mammaliicoccus lentus]WHI59334.1 hypothetical protein PYH69_11490 [Mammaliicoccus lentus]